MGTPYPARKERIYRNKLFQSQVMDMLIVKNSPKYVIIWKNHEGTIEKSYLYLNKNLIVSIWGKQLLYLFKIKYYGNKDI